MLGFLAGSLGLVLFAVLILLLLSDCEIQFPAFSCRGFKISAISFRRSPVILPGYLFDPEISSDGFTPLFFDSGPSGVQDPLFTLRNLFNWAICSSPPVP